MSEANRTHPAGVPAPTQPYDKVPEYGDIDFRRLVTKQENTTNPEQGKTEEEVEEVRGHKYKLASNISHVDDDHVRVEDFSDINIDPQLEQQTQDLFQEVLTCDGKEKPAYSRSQNEENVTTEKFSMPSPFGDLHVCRKKYHFIDVHEEGSKARRQYSQSPIAKRIEKIARDRAGPAPSEAQVEHVACRILARTGRKLLTDKGRKREKLPKLLRQAQEELYLHRNDAAYHADLTNEMNGAKPADCTITQEDVKLVKKMPNSSNPFDKFQVDNEAAKACELIEGFDIIICRDKNNRLILGQFTNAVQRLFSAEILNKMARATQAAAYRLPILQPEPLRHATSQAIHLARFPNKDVNSEKCEQPHLAVCGVEHIGAHHEKGNSSGLAALCFEDFFAKRERCNAVLKSSAWGVEKQKLETSVYGTATKVSRVSLKAWDPELYDEVLEVREKLPEPLQLTMAKTGDNPYGYLAHLFDAQTEGHKDSTDWEGGLAALTCFGDFTGGNFVVPELDLNIPFPSGSNCHLRGREIYHYVTGYEGHRYCVVLTNKESVRKTIPNFEKGYKAMMEKVAKLQVKDVEDLENWPKDEKKLYEANKKGKNAVLELLWDSEREKCHPEKKNPAKGSRQRSKSEKDDPGQPAPKKQKTSKS